MIICDLINQKFGYKGTRAALIADITCILREILRNEDITEQDIDFICQRAKNKDNDSFADEMFEQNPEALVALAQFVAVANGDENLMAAVKLYRELKEEEDGEGPEDNQD